MHWILQDDFFSGESWPDVLVAVLERFDIPYSLHKVVPLVGELIPEWTGSTTNVILIGSYSMRHAAKHYGFTPGVFDLGPFDFTVQKEHWGSEMLNHDSVVCAFRDLVFIEESMFVRPVIDSKSFTGKICTRKELVAWKQDEATKAVQGLRSLRGDTLIQVSPLKSIFAEYRYWIVDGRIVTRSLYKQGGHGIVSSHVDERFDGYVRERIAKWQPHDAFVIDVCDTPHGIKVVEINTLNAAGFYAADLMKLVMALESRFDEGG